ncbi:hypothetical protein JG688_00007020 [Phytophthora aleatoria]|uniref:ABC transporter domain-containing protein n=1 Tax=Phytophthora aleatoria TaxID=2496075 RepID=A0A8J5M8F3_9STRA|nr:hypothetical protein JG688_00007020 [Phytophthora aleatoria]
MGIVYQTSIFLSVGQSSEIPTFIAAREIYYKQRRASFYRTSSFVIAYLTAFLSVVVCECVGFGSLVYWMCGFAAEMGPFVVFLLGMILSSMALSSSFVVLSVLSPNLDVAQPLATLSNVIFSVFAGFVVPLAQFPDYFSWLYWLNPVTWCVRSVIVSQYRSSSFEVCMYGDENYCERFNNTMGEYLLSQYDVPSNEVWVWGGMVYLAVVVVLFVAAASYMLEHIRFDAPMATNDVTSSNIKRSPKKEVKQLEQQYSNAGNVDYYFKIGSAAASSIIFVSDTAIHDEKKPFEPVTLAFTNLWYSVKTEHASIDLLKDVSGYALPGTMTALMGSSDAGKTTLMDVIAGRKTGGSIRGEIMLNGFLATERAIRRCTGYCEQQDTHSEGSTIREALTFSALLRQDSNISLEAKRESVEECLDLLGLRSIADQVIRGRSQEQMKRLTIGVELAAQPSVLFLDEPTSGLDAHSAKIIMDGVRKVANTGRTVVCTIHQPSSDIFFLFDSLLVLKRGGEMVFFGNLVAPCPDPRECGHLIDYFESIPGVPRLPEDYTSYQGINSAVGVILMTTLCQGNISFNSVLPFTTRERASFYRERNAQTYNVFWYVVGSTLVEIPYAFISGLLFSIIFYPMMGFTSLTTGLLYWVNVSLFVLVETYLGQFLTLFVFPGVYNEQVSVPKLAGPLVLQGYTCDTTSYAANEVTITQAKAQKDIPPEIENNRNYLTSTLGLKSSKVKVYNFNVANTAGKIEENGQAVAIYADGADYGFYACNFTGYQDTVCANKGRELYAKSYINGAVDFVFGQRAMAWFESCDIESIGEGWLTANGNANATLTSEYVFNNAHVFGNGSTYLGRPWRPFARVVWQNSELGDIVNPEGWAAWDDSTSTADVYFKEFNNSGPGAAIDQRVAFSEQLDAPVAITDILGENYESEWWVDTNFL